MAEDRPKVRVACAVPNGLALQLLKPFDDGSGTKTMVRCGPKVLLRGPRSPRSDLSPSAEVTEVDAEFWNAWLEQNKSSPLVVEKHVQAYEEPKAAPEK